jgi:hypothetical protein
VAVTDRKRQSGERRDEAPLLLAVIHTEEEFDWSAPFDRRNNGVTNIGSIGRGQEIFERLGVKPIYMVDYPVAAQDESVAALRSAIAGSAATIGAHLHPWVSPPYDEVVSLRTSYPGNLPVVLEREKLRLLSEQIALAFGAAPQVYLAGRYGFGDNTLSILQELGYRIDLSGVAMTSYVADTGPDYRSWDNSCFWEGEPPILRIPHTVADVGVLCRAGKRLFDPEASAALRRLRVPGILARLRAVQRIRLSPEGFSLEHLKSCAATLVDAGYRVLLFSFHSPSLVPGFTPYVRDDADLAAFLNCMERFLRFFRDELGGRFASPDDVADRMALPGPGHSRASQSAARRSAAGSRSEAGQRW